MDIIKIIKKILKVSGITILIVLLLTLGINAVGLALKDERQLTPWRTGFFLIASGSMEPTMPVGSLIIVTEVSAYEIKENDVITFFSSNELETVTHRVREVIRDENGHENGYVYITRGDANNTDDPPLNYERVIGRVSFVLPGMGFFVGIFSSIQYMGIAIIGIGVILSVYGVVSAKKKQY